MKTILSSCAPKHTFLTSGSSSLCAPISCLSARTCTLAINHTAGHLGIGAPAECACLRAGWEVPHAMPASAALPDRARARSCSGICPRSSTSCLGECTCTRTPAAHRAADLHRQAQVPTGGSAHANPGCFSARPGVQPGVHMQQQRSGDPCRPCHHI